MSQMKETGKYFLVVSMGVLISSTVWSPCVLCLIGTNRVALFGKLLVDSCQKLKKDVQTSMVPSTSTRD